MALLISIRDCGDVSVVDLFGRSTFDTSESELLSKDLRKFRLLDIVPRFEDETDTLKTFRPQGDFATS